MLPIAAAAVPLLTTLAQGAAVAAPYIAGAAGVAANAAAAGKAGPTDLITPGEFAEGELARSPVGQPDTGFDWRGAIRGALKGLQGNDRRDLMGQIDRPAPMPAGGGRVPGLTPPQFGVAEQLMQRATNARHNWGGSVPGLGY